MVNGGHHDVPVRVTGVGALVMWTLGSDERGRVVRRSGLQRLDCPLVCVRNRGAPLVDGQVLEPGALVLLAGGFLVLGVRWLHHRC